MRHTSPVVSHSPAPRVSAGDDSQGSQMCLRHTAPVISVTGDTQAFDGHYPYLMQN